MSQEIITYDKHKYQKLEVEESAPNSGRYHILDRTPMTVYGVLDDEAIYNETESLVNNFVFDSELKSTMLRLSGKNISKIFTTLRALASTDNQSYKARFDAVLAVIREMKVIITSKPYAHNDKIYFPIQAEDGETDILILEEYTSSLIIVGG